MGAQGDGDGSGLDGAWPQPNWYPDPEDSRRWRYWDGLRWTDIHDGAGDDSATTADEDAARGVWGPFTIMALVALLLVILVLLVVVVGVVSRSASDGTASPESTRLEQRFVARSGFPLPEGRRTCELLHTHWSARPLPPDPTGLVRAQLIRDGYAHTEARALIHHATDNLCSITGTMRD